MLTNKPLHFIKHWMHQMLPDSGKVGKHWAWGAAEELIDVGLGPNQNLGLEQGRRKSRGGDE